MFYFYKCIWSLVNLVIDDIGEVNENVVYVYCCY